MRVMKFCGTSVGNAERMRSVVTLVREALAEDRVLVVASAVAGVTNLLVDGARTAAEAGDIGSVSARFRARGLAGGGPRLPAAAHPADVLKIATKATL